jgi:transketolase
VSDPELVTSIVERIKPLLFGKPPPVQGAVLADLLAMWLAAHWIPGDQEETKEARAQMLAQHMETVITLTEVNAKILGTDQ